MIRCKHTKEKSSPVSGIAERSEAGIVVLRTRTLDAEVKVRGERHEDDDRNDLPRQTSNHDIDTGLLARRAGVRGGSDPTTGTLENQREEVEDDERDGVCARLEARKALTIDDDDARQAEVDGGREEGRADGQADEVEQEVTQLERVAVQLDTTSVTQDLEEKAEERAHRVTPHLVADTDAQADKQVQTKDAEQDGIADHVWQILDAGNL